MAYVASLKEAYVLCPVCGQLIPMDEVKVVGRKLIHTDHEFVFPEGRDVNDYTVALYDDGEIEVGKAIKEDPKLYSIVKSYF